MIHDPFKQTLLDRMMCPRAAKCLIVVFCSGVLKARLPMLALEVHRSAAKSLRPGGMLSTRLS